MDDDNACPGCGADLTGPPIPEADRHLFGGGSHFSRIIGIDDPAADAITRWMCPDCGCTWPRKGYE